MVNGREVTASETPTAAVEEGGECRPVVRKRDTNRCKFRTASLEAIRVLLSADSRARHRPAARGGGLGEAPPCEPPGAAVRATWRRLGACLLPSPAADIAQPAWLATHETAVRGANTVSRIYEESSSHSSMSASRALQAIKGLQLGRRSTQAGRRDSMAQLQHRRGSPWQAVGVHVNPAYKRQPFACANTTSITR